MKLQKQKSPAGATGSLAASRIAQPEGAEDDDECVGWTKGPFGILKTTAGTTVGVLEAALTHLTSGMRDSLETAAVAGDLAERVGDWSTLKPEDTPTSKWQVAGQALYELWYSAGIVNSPVLGRTA